MRGALGWVIFGVHLTGAGAGPAIATAVIGTAALCGVAYAAATFIPSIDAAGPLVMRVMFTVNAISGIHVPASLFPAWLRDAAQVLPVRPLAVAIVAAWGLAGALFASAASPGPPRGTDSGPAPEPRPPAYRARTPCFMIMNRRPA